MSGVSGCVRQRAGKRGPVWYARYRDADGKQRQKALGRVWRGSGRLPEGYVTKRMAQGRLEAILTDARRAGPADPNRGSATFADAAAEFLRYVEDVRQIDPDTVADYRGVIEGYLLAEFGEVPLETITPDQIDAYKERLLAEGKLSNRTVVRHLTVLHGLFKRAKRVWGLTANPASAELVERPKVIYTGEFDTLTRDEIELLATHAATEQDAALYRVAAYTGLRQGELLALRWSCVDFLGGLLHVRRNFTHGVDKVPKGKKVRSVPMVPDVIDALATLKGRGDFTAESDLVFANDVGEYLDHFKLRRRYYTALEHAGLRRVRFHDLRHGFGTAAIAQLDPYTVQSYMGHAHYSTTQRYLHHQPRREDAAKLAEAFGGEVGHEHGHEQGTSSASQDNSEQLNHA